MDSNLELLLDAAGATAHVGLMDGEQLVAEAVSTVRASHGEALLPLIVQVLGAHPLPSVQRVVVGAGPGSFTGIRVALATALGLRRARAGELPVVAVSSFACGAALARAAGKGPEPLWISVPSLPGEFYLERWQDGVAVAGSATVRREAELPTDAPIWPAECTVQALWWASRGLPSSDELLPCYVAPPRIHGGVIEA